MSTTVTLPDEADFDRWLPYDSGYANAQGYNLDPGYGDPSSGGMYMSLGFGDPWVIGEDSPLTIEVYTEVDVDPASRWASPSRYSPRNQASHEGGTLLKIRPIGLTWPAGPHRVDLVAVSDGATYPQLHPGMNSGRFGQGSAIYPEPGLRYLVAATPYAPVGSYIVRVTMPDGSVIVSREHLELVYTPGCDALERMTALPNDVYRPRVPKTRVHAKPWPSNMIGGILFSIAKELQFLHGVPETRLLQDFNPGDTQLVPISTHGFAPSGRLVVDDAVVDYTSRTTEHFNVVDVPRIKSYPAGTIIRPAPYVTTPTRYIRGR